MTASKYPFPPSGKSGWPWPWSMSWSKSSLLLESRDLPLITIVTPSFNQGHYLEETIRSVLLQGYPRIEYIVMDGGSTDKSIEILRNYSDFITHWQSERDNGQADAIKRGFKMAKGEILGWLNSDDYLMPGALHAVAERFMADKSVQMLIGAGWVVDEAGSRIRKMYSYPVSFESLLYHGQFFNQMSTFWRKDFYQQVGGIDENLKFCFDYELFLKMVKIKDPVVIDAVLSSFRLHGESKTSTIWDDVAVPEANLIRSRYFQHVAAEAMEEITTNATKNYHKAIRIKKVKDILMDPRYFFFQFYLYMLNHMHLK
jgi:glycosyltransferase involved in cell wall biosynthesis